MWSGTIKSLKISKVCKNNGEQWSVVKIINERRLPKDSHPEYESDTFIVPAGTAFIRFTVNTIHNSAEPASVRASGANTSYSVRDKDNEQYIPARAASVTNPSFAVSRMGLKQYIPTVKPGPSYQQAPVHVIAAANRQLYNAMMNTLFNYDYELTNADYAEAYSKLKPHYDNLMAIQEDGIHTSIEEVSVDQPESVIIYDLMGRCLNKIVAPGIYIINSRKVVVR